MDEREHLKYIDQLSSHTKQVSEYDSAEIDAAIENMSISGLDQS